MQAVSELLWGEVAQRAVGLGSYPRTGRGGRTITRDPRFWRPLIAMGRNSAQFASGFAPGFLEDLCSRENGP